MPPYKFLRKTYAESIFASASIPVGKDRAHDEEQAHPSGRDGTSSFIIAAPNDEWPVSYARSRLEGDEDSIESVSDFEPSEGSTYGSEAGLSVPDTGVMYTVHTPDYGTNYDSDGESELSEPPEAEGPSVIEELSVAEKPTSSEELSVVEKSLTVTKPPGAEDAPVPETEETEDESTSEESDDSRLLPDKVAIIKELTRKAKDIRHFAIADWLKQQKKVESLSSSDEARSKTLAENRGPPPASKEWCPFDNCDTLFNQSSQARRRHLMTHYPDACFCPICDKHIMREDSVDRHFNRTVKDCLADPEAVRFRLSRLSNGKIKHGLDRKYFNIYYLGVMEDFDMPDDHFQMIARRERHAPITIA